jgi:hypothetical protein
VRYWVYEGNAKIGRYVYPCAPSLDGPRYDRVKCNLALSRLAFGQPGQEDPAEGARSAEHEGTERATSSTFGRPPIDALISCRSPGWL